MLSLDYNYTQLVPNSCSHVFSDRLHVCAFSMFARVF